MPLKSILLRLIVTAILFLGLGNACSLNSGDLEIEAQIIYTMGGPQPVARTTFYLLNTDIARLADLQKAYEDARLQAEVDRMEHPSIPRLHFPSFLMKEGSRFWEAHVVQSVKTDFQGRATFEPPKLGDYWVFGIAEARGDKHVIWNVQAKVNRGRNRLVLSNDNYGFKWPTLEQ